MGRKPVRRITNRPYTRQRRALDGSTPGSASVLASQAGLTQRPSIDQLERRQMLFSLAVTADTVDPQTGLGTVRGFFGYAIPQIFTNVDIQAPQAPTVVTPAFGQLAYGALPNNGFIGGNATRVLVRHNIAPATDIAIDGDPRTADNQNRYIRVNQNQLGEFFSFTFFSDNVLNPSRQSVSQAQFNITGDGNTDNTGLLTDQIQVDLLIGTLNGGQVVATFNGAQLRALIAGQGSNPLLGTGTLTLAVPDGAFDTVRFRLIGAPGVGINPAFRITSMSYTIPDSPFATLLEGRAAWAEVVLTGPVGATAVVADLYGRDMRRTIIIMDPNDTRLLAIDRDFNGIPDFNDGIGSIRILNSDSRTALTVWGGKSEFFTDQPPPDADFIEGNAAFTITSDLTGLYDEFQTAGFAYAFDVRDDNVIFAGLPPGPGSVIIGSPYVRPLNNYNPAGVAPGVQNPVTTGFSRADQGIFVPEGNIGSIYIHGILHGSSQFAGFVDRIYAGYLVGSITVQGDLGSLVVGTDAGQWTPEPDFTFTDPNITLDATNKTASTLFVGRTLGEIAIAGRSLLDVLVVGDLNNPSTRPARDVFTYYEKEYVNGMPLTLTLHDVVNTVLTNNAYSERQSDEVFRGVDQAMVFGTGFFRNDQIMGAEWVGSISTGVRIKGDLSGRDPTQGEDRNDVYAFAVDGTHDINIEGFTDVFAPYMRIVDERGRTLAAPQGVDVGTSTQLRLHPNGPGVYYLVITDPQGNDNGVGMTKYTITITGMAAASLGAYRTGGGSGFTDVATGEGNSVVVLAGNIGSLRIGTGLIDGAGAEISPLPIYNTRQPSADDSMSFQGGSFSAPGNLYNITAGSDIGNPGGQTGGGGAPIDIRIGGNFGTLFTGMSAVVGGGAQEGDLNFFTLTVGGHIGSIQVSGGIGMDQDADPGDPLAPVGGFVTFVTGSAGGHGDIGMFRVGFHVHGDSLFIRTSPGSTVGAFLIDQDTPLNPVTPGGRTGVYDGLAGINWVSGAGSDVRFVDIPSIDLINSNNVLTPIIGGQVVTLTDDGGSVVRISVENALEGVQVGSIRTLRIDGSQGVAVGRIVVDLSGGGILHIDGLSSGASQPISIGRIIVVNGNGASAINITGTVPIDVYRIDSASALDNITNSSGGDIVVADVAALNSLNLNGDLGRTEVPAWGPSLIGPYMGLQLDLNPEVGGVLGLTSDAATTFFRFFAAAGAAAMYRPLTSDDFNNVNITVEDIGSPLDGYLNGIVVRNGSVAEVNVKGTIGDLILQDVAGTLASVIANSDGISPLGRFEGISGHVFASNIGSIDVGDGLAASDGGPFATTGIVAVNDMASVLSSRASGVRINGTINASNATNDGNLETVEGLNDIQFNNGTVADAFISASSLDDFWSSFNYTDNNIPSGNIGNVRFTNTNFFRSRMTGINLEDFTLSGANGFFDASVVGMTGTIRLISATGYRNSTLNGELLEIAENSITAARDVTSIVAIGDMSDLTIDVTGSILTSISAVNISRSTLAIDAELKSLIVTRDLRASSVIVGTLPSLTAGRNIQSSQISVSGRIGVITAGNQIASSKVEVTGPGGNIGTITALSLISGSISATGPIGTITVTSGDLAAAITTTNGGNVTGLSAGRDLAITGDISGSVGTLTAGRHFGAANKPGALVIRGNLTSATATNGQLYSDLRVGQTIGTVTLGGATNKVGNNLVGTGSIIAFGSIASVVVNGDFDGDIISYSGGISSIAINNGSLLPGNTIAAYDGSLNSVVITNGSLFGNVHADVNIVLLSVIAGSDGVFGDIGINPVSSNFVSYDARRNQLPPGVVTNSTVQGPTISAGNNIVSIQVPGGSVFEAYFTAGRSITNIVIGGTVQNDFVTLGISSVFAAGDSIDSVTVRGGVNNTAFIAGLVNFGSDGRLGGQGLAADTVKPGSIKGVTITNGIVDAKFTAGIDAGFDGVYNTSDDLSVQGISTVSGLNISGFVGNVSVFGDTLSTAVANDTRFVRGGTNLPSTNSQIDSNGLIPGTAFTGTRVFNNVNGANLTITFSGPGTAIFNPATSLLTLRNTTSASNVTLSSSTGTLNNVDVVTNDDASLGTVTYLSAVTGDSDLIVDGNVNTITYATFSGTGSITIGGDVTTATFASFAGGFFTAQNASTVRINGQFGATAPTTFNEVRIDLLSVGAIAITGQASGVISVTRGGNSLTINGTVDRSAFRFGQSLGAFSAPNFLRSFLSTGDNLGPVTITGDVTQSNISSGADLGTDAAPGGTGAAADRVSSGSIGAVTIAGNFSQSSLVAGYLRGKDGFFGTGDDIIAGGRSTITSVTIGGTQTGSSRNSEAYRIASNGTMGLVRIGGSTFSGTIGNFATESLMLQPQTVQVTDIRVSVTSGVSTARLTFNQPVDVSTISSALSVSQVTGTGNIEDRLVEGLDFTLSYENSTNTVLVTFSTTVTSRDLPQVPGRPGPGVYRFRFDQARLHGRLTGVLLDGNGNGISTPGESFSGDTVVGDAGDKLAPEVIFTGINNAYRVDLYGPTNLDIVLDNNSASDGQPDTNTVYTIRGFIGDNPDNDTNFFRFGGDLDVYSVTLQAGQILRLGALRGTAVFARVNVLDPAGNPVNLAGLSNAAVALDPSDFDPDAFTTGTDLLIKDTGTYIIAIGNATNIATPGAVTNPNSPPGGIGDYNLTIQIFDDGDSGFNATTDAGDGRNLVNAPAPISFAGNDHVLGTSDDIPSITVGEFVFTYSKGTDNIAGNADDLVTGTTSDGQVTSTRNGNGTAVSTISSSIGPAGHAGIPLDVAADVDIFKLNNGNPITPGTQLTITVKLTDLGADLGSATFGSISDTRGSVQFGVFDISASTNIDDASMVFSPTDFRATGADANNLISDNGSTRYGYDANGDFFITFLAPDRQDLPGNAATLAVYLQGVRNTDYQIQVVTGGTLAIPDTQVQNILLETTGGSIDWLQVGGLTTTLRPFDAGTLALVGSINGLSVQDYIITNVIAQLNSLFQNATGTGTGFNVHFSTNPADFEFQPFSTVFLSSTTDPVSPIFNPFIDPTAQPYGYSQHSDALNADLSDEAVVFVPSFALQGLSAGKADVDQFIQATTAAIARRTGELMGLRVTNAYADNTNVFDPFAANSVDSRPGPGRAYTLPGFGRDLSDPFDAVTRSNFYLGQQNARSLLDKVLAHL